MRFLFKNSSKKLFLKNRKKRKERQLNIGGVGMHYAIATQRRATLADDDKDSVVILRNLGDTVDRLDDQNPRPIY